MTPKTQPSDFPNRDPDLFYELARDRLAVQLEAVDALDNKIGLLASLASALMGILAAVVSLRRHSLNGAEILLIGLSVAVYLGISYKAIRAYFSRSWKTGPNLTSVWKLLWSDADDQFVKWKVTKAYWEAQECNVSGFKKKAEVLPFLLIGVVTQTALLAALALALARGKA